jgi:hypothetical protein
LSGPEGSDELLGMAQDEIALVAALDARHAEAIAAFDHRDIKAYSDLFSDSLRYERSDGKVIGKSQLMRDVKAQFRRLSRAKSSFVRDSSIVEGRNVAETLNQHVVCEASAFGFVRRRWSLERRGRYTWTLEDGHWRIIDVRISDEQLGSGWKPSF